jgi:hypothetical protein
VKDYDLLPDDQNFVTILDLIPYLSYLLCDLVFIAGIFPERLEMHRPHQLDFPPLLR